MRSSLLLLVLLFCIFGVKCAQDLDYGIMIDAGSSGSRIYLYEWPHRDHNTLPLVEPTSINQTVISQKINTPLSSFASKPSDAGASLEPLITYVKKYLAPSKYAETPIYLKATAGMRALEQADQDKIIANVRQYLSTTPFKFTNPQEQAQVIPGTDEGIFGWITVNYALQLLQKINPTTKGALDMGGASTQITFVPQSPPTSYAFNEALGPNTFNLYTYSYPLGQDQAGRLLLAGLLNDSKVDANGNILNPCYLSGFNETYSSGSVQVIGTGDYSACQTAVKKYIVVTANDCASTCGIGNVYQPSVYGDYYAFSGYAYTNTFFNLSSTSTIQQLIDAGSAYCAQTYQTAKAQHPNDSDSFLKNYCFTSTYISEILLKFGFSASSTQIHTQTNVGTIELTWALGGMIYEANLLPFGSSASSLTSFYGLFLFVFASLFLM